MNAMTSYPLSGPRFAALTAAVLLVFGLTPVWAQEMDHSMHQPPQQTESAPESSKPGDPHAGHDTASPQSTQASNEPAQPQQMEHSMHAPAYQYRSVSNPPSAPSPPPSAPSLSYPIDPFPPFLSSSPL